MVLNNLLVNSRYSRFRYFSLVPCCTNFTAKYARKKHPFEEVLKFNIDNNFNLNAIPTENNCADI